MRHSILALLLSVVAFTLLSGCSDKDEKKQEVSEEGTYFSIIDFTKDQWATHRGEPFGITKKVYFNGKVDSLSTNALDMDWTPVLKAFFETDISDPKYLGQYDFSLFDDTISNTRTYYYEANNEKLYTRKVQVTASLKTLKVQSIYIEGFREDHMSTKNVRLLYDPLKVISIQETERSGGSKPKEMRVVYEFL